jgi:membrane-associated phospholipid phosphatase
LNNLIITKYDILKKNSAMLHKFLILFFLFVTIQFSIIAQKAKKDTIPETKGEIKQENKPYNVTQFLHESYLFVKQPTTWRGNDWLKVGVVTAATIAFMPLDKRITNSTQGQQRYYYSIPVVGGRVYGEWYSIGGVAAIFGIYGLVTNKDAPKKISIELFQAGLYAEAATFALKIVIGRARPYSNAGAFSFKPFRIKDDDFHSFPSGHTTSAMALSTVMSRHANSTALKIISYMPAALTMFSRVYQNKHWLSDEIPAAAIGYFVGNWVVDMHEGRKHRINVTSVYPPAFSINLNWDTVQK